MSRTHSIMEQENRFVAANYHPLPVVMVRGEGVWLWDVEGNRYLDMMSAYSAVNHGHSHPRLVKVLQEQSAQLVIPSRAFYNDKLGMFIEKLCQVSGLDKAIPMNTGAEAVETAIKAMRRWGYQVKGIAPEKAEIIVADHNFHGRTTTLVGFSSEPSYREGFGPFTPGFKSIPFGDLTAFKNALTPNVCGVLLEPIQGEAGIFVPPEGWLSDVKEICRQENILFVLDEIQSGLGRTGKWFAYQHENVKPDGIIVGKALGGGLLPVSAFVARQDVIDVFSPGSHGSTFGGNALAAAVAYEALCILEEENLIQNSACMGDLLHKGLKNIKSPLIKEIRGRGLWAGIEIDSSYSGRKLCEALLKKGVLSKETHETVIRIAPPLLIKEEQLENGLKIIQKVFEEL